MHTKPRILNWTTINQFRNENKIFTYQAITETKKISF